MMNRFYVVITVYNGEKTIERCLDSVINQRYKLFTTVLVDDCSTDKTIDIASRYNITIIDNHIRMGSAVAGLKAGISLAQDNDIIVWVDGDDYLIDNKVLSYLNDLYDESTWLTYGQYTSLSGRLENMCQPFDNIRTVNEIGQRIYVSIDTSQYRASGLWFTSHLKTFRKWLFDKIKPEDLLNEEGEHFKTCCDVCCIIPMIEMAGIEHIKYIDKVLYVYNDTSNDYGGRSEENLRNFAYIHNKIPYSKL